MPQFSKDNNLLRVVAAVCESMDRSREPRVYDDGEVIAEFDRLDVTTFRRLLKTLPALPEQIRRHTVLALGRLRYRTAASALFRLILDEDKVASAAAVALSDIADSKLVQRALRELPKAHPEFVRYALVEFLICYDEVTAEQSCFFLNSCLTIALDQCEGHSLRSRTLEAIALCGYRLDKRTRLAKRIPHELANLAADASRDVRASAAYALRVLRETGFI